MVDILDLYKERNFTVEDIDNLNPEIRVIIDNYLYFDSTGDSKYEIIADSLLEKLITQLTILKLAGSVDRLYSIGCGIIYLLRNEWLQGEEDDILSDMDNYLFILVEHKEKCGDFKWGIVLKYLRLRIMGKSESSDLMVSLMLKQLCVKMLDIIKEESVILDTNMKSEIKLIHEMKLCPYLTTRLLNLLSDVYIHPKPIDGLGISFVIPLRVDSMERSFNMDFVLKQLNMIENAEIFIIEADTMSKYKLKNSSSKINYSFVYDESVVFHRTKYLNLLLSQVKNPIVGIWDTDVIIDRNQINDAVNSIIKGDAMLSFPYDGDFYTLTDRETDFFLSNCLNSDVVKTDWMFENLSCIRHSVGGAFFVNKKCYQEIGGENEQFIGWGAEDLERVKRCQILGYKIFRAKGPLFHLYHPRNINSYYGSDELELKNRQEFLKVCALSNQELLSYINTWKWL